MKLIPPVLLSLLLLQGCAGGFIIAAGTAVAVSGDERSISQQIDDDNLAASAIDKVVTLNEYHHDMRINIVTNNGYLLLIGQVDTQMTSNKIENELGKLKGVKAVYNPLRVNHPIGAIQQTRDTWITTKVKSLLSNHDKIDLLKIKVVTENGEVFLIGQVTQTMSDYATGVARKITGVKQVVRVFDLIPEKS